MPEWHAYHGRSSAQHQAEFDDLSGRGFRMISLSVYGNPNNLRYAGVWSLRSDPAFIAFHGKTEAEYQQLFDQHTANGYRPTILCATGGGVAPPIFAGVFEEGTWDFFVRFGADAVQFRRQSDDLRAAGFVMRWLSVYGDAVNPRYAGVWEANTRPVSWALELEDDWDTYQKKFDAYTSGRMRPECVSVAHGDRYAAIWYDDLIGDWFSFNGMTASGYQKKFDEMKSQGFMPIRVQAGGVWNDPRFAAVFARDDQRPSRQWTVRGPSASSLAAFDDVVKNFMEVNGVRAGQLAVVRHGKLVYARAFTHAEPAYPITELSTVFRVASVSKTITATAPLALIEREQLSLDDRMQDILSLKTPSGGVPSDPDFTKTRVWHLPSHSSGLDDNVDNAPSPKVVADAFGMPLPVTRDQYARFAATLTVTNPGPHVSYNSLGFFLLGQILAGRTGGTYDSYVNANIWAPLGVTRAKVAPLLVQDRLPTEAWYQPSMPGLGKSVMSADEPFVPVQYGTQYTEIGAAMGGWALGAADYAKLWASFDIGAHNPVMSPQTVQTMWTNPPGTDRADALCGWWLGPAGVDVTAIGHNGGFQGTGAAIWRRSDGVSVVAIFNRDLDLDFSDGAPFGTQMNAAISGVTEWPTQDLSPMSA
jgi:CubicO group peptidase (beta-lactamase class C family)